MIDNTNYLVLGLGGSWILQVEAAAPGRCGSFTGAWFHPRPRRCQWSRLGIRQTNFFGRQTKVFGGSWSLPGRGGHAFYIVEQNAHVSQRKRL